MNFLHYTLAILCLIASTVTCQHQQYYTEFYELSDDFDILGQKGGYGGKKGGAIIGKKGAVTYAPPLYAAEAPEILPTVYEVNKPIAKAAVVAPVYASTSKTVPVYSQETVIQPEYIAAPQVINRVINQPVIAPTVTQPVVQPITEFQPINTVNSVIQPIVVPQTTINTELTSTIIPTAEVAKPIVNQPIKATLPTVQAATPTAIAKPIIQPVTTVETPAVVGPTITEAVPVAVGVASKGGYGGGKKGGHGGY